MKGNIVYIINSLGLGGTENLVFQMSQAFQKDYNISVICLDDLGIWAEQLREKGIPVHCFWRQPGMDLSIAGKIAKFCRQYAIHIIHAHQCTPWFYGALSRVICPHPKLLFEEHGRHYPERYSWKKNLINKTLIQNLTHKIVAVSRDVAKRLEAYEGISPSRIRVIYNGVRSPILISNAQRKKLRENIGLSENDFVIGSVGRLDPIKNYPLLLKALAEAKQKNGSLKALLVGSGPDLSTLQELAETLHLKEDVIFPGYRKDATELLQCMDLFILCSFSEGTSMALLEAMASGIPAVVTEVGGNPELITNNQNGWVVRSEDQKALTGAILEAFNNPEKRRMMAEKSRVLFQTSFEFDAMLSSYSQLYQALLLQNTEKLPV